MYSPYCFKATKINVQSQIRTHHKYISSHVHQNAVRKSKSIPYHFGLDLSKIRPCIKQKVHWQTQFNKSVPEKLSQNSRIKQNNKTKYVVPHKLNEFIKL